MFICKDCGHIFDESEVWTESRGMFQEQYAYESVDGCPLCRGEYEEAKFCLECESVFKEDDVLGGCYCKKCLSEKFSYAEALEYLQENKLLADFIFSSLWNIDSPTQTSQEFELAMKEVFLRMVADDRIRNVDEFLDLLWKYCIDEGDGGHFAQWLYEKSEENK